MCVDCVHESILFMDYFESQNNKPNAIKAIWNSKFWTTTKFTFLQGLILNCH